MKTMKKLVAALLVLTMVLALVGSAFAECTFKVYYAKFNKNARAYDAAKSSAKTKDPEVIVRKGSKGAVIAKKGNYLLVALTPFYVSDDSYGNTEVTFPGGDVRRTWAYWFKKGDLKFCKYADWEMLVPIKSEIDVTFSNGGVGKSGFRIVKADGSPKTFKDTGNIELDDLKDLAEDLGITVEAFLALDSTKAIRITKDCMKKIKANAKVWMHKEPSLKKNYGVALHSGDKVTYRRVWSYDNRFVIFYGIKYKGKCLWVSQKYTTPVKK